MIGVYAIKHSVTGKYYIGSSISLRKRRERHFRDLRKGIHDNYLLQEDFNEYGLEYIEFFMIEEFPDDSMTKEQLLDIEQKWIDYYMEKDICYNINPNARDCTGKTHKEETKRKISEANKGTKPAPQTIEAIKNPENLRRRALARAIPLEIAFKIKSMILEGMGQNAISRELGFKSSTIVHDIYHGRHTHSESLGGGLKDWLN